MIKIEIKAEQAKQLMKLLPANAKKALYWACRRTVESTANFAAKEVGKETKIKYRAILRGIKVTLPKSGSEIIRGEIYAKTGDFIPLSGSPMRVRWIVKQPKNYTKSTALRRYPLVSVKLFGKNSYTEIPGAFTAQLIGGNQRVITSIKKQARVQYQKTGIKQKIAGRRHKALLIRRNKQGKRLPLRELVTNQPDMALYLNKHQSVIQTYAQKTLDSKLGDEIKFRTISQIKKNLR
jgi:hypothetical protein